MFLHKNKINELITSQKLIIRPLLSENQLGAITIDFRLGTDFLVSRQGRSPYIDLSRISPEEPIKNFFAATRRRIGQEFTFYPQQTVLCSSLEYVKLPNNIAAFLTMRSSYSRTGLAISTIVQPGYCGCISIELTNVNNNPIRIAVGARIFQARLYQYEEKVEYLYDKRKYICQVRPETANLNNESDIEILSKIN